MNITLEQARAVIQGSTAAAARLGLNPITVVVLDAGGHVIAAERQDGSPPAGFEIARGKANGAIALGVGSRALMARAIEQPFFVSAANTAIAGALIPVPGGVLAVDPTGATVGAVGVSGDTSDHDELCAVAGIESVGVLARVD